MKQKHNRTLYVDVDDTLVIWELDSSLDPALRWKLNPAVVKAMEEWEGRIVVWSLGGAEYAYKMANAALEGLHVLDRVVEFLAKEPIFSRVNVFIDDDPLASFRSRSIHPEQLDTPDAIALLRQDG